jgi:hypothetical protein
MSWYLALVVRASYVDDSRRKERLADMLYRLVEAPDAETAYARALQMVEEVDESYTDDDGTEVELRGMGLADLRPIEAAQLADGVEVYAEVLGGDPAEKLAEKEQLTVFEPTEIPDSEVDTEAAARQREAAEAVDVASPDDDRFSSNTPIR